MKLGCRVSLLLLSLVIVAGCGPSQADYDRAKRQVSQLTTERDNYKSQLDQAVAKIQTLQQQVQTLQTAATAKPEEGTAAKSTAKASKKKTRAKARRTKKR
jgi:outer membrane murein-binding lipoprotein Lpp